jgi:hypothetical protein
MNNGPPSLRRRINAGTIRPGGLGIIYVIQTPTWEHLPDRTKNTILNKVRRLFSNLLSIQLIYENDIPNVINMADSVIYLQESLQFSRITEIFTQQWDYVNSQVSLPPLEIRGGHGYGKSLMYKTIVNYQGQNAKLSITCSEAYFQQSSGAMWGHHQNQDINYYSTATHTIQNELGIIIGNIIAHEIRHQYIQPHVNSGLGMATPDPIDSDGLRFTREDFREISQVIQDFHDNDQTIPANVNTRQ